LLENFDISPIFNVVDFYEFHEGEEDGELDTINTWKKQLPIKLVEELEKILENRVCRRTRNKYYLEYLVKWKNISSQ
jgi:hypothetical protein